MPLALLWLFLAIIVAVYAARRGRSAIGWFLLACVISPLIAFLLCLAVGPADTAASEPSAESHVKCPDCRELVLRDARVCKHCGAKLVPQDVPAAPVRAAAPATNFVQVWQRNKGLIIVLAVIILLALSASMR